MSQPLTTRLVFWFAFLGPLGKLIPLPGLPGSFRFYYILLLPAILIYFFRGVRRRTFHHFLLLLPILIYMLVSAAYTYITFVGFYESYEEGNPLIRFVLIVALLVFTVCAGEEAHGFSEENKLKVISLFLKGYLLSLLVGYIFFVGYYARILSVAFLSHFQILVQWGFGILRFSPGSYPNEYGVVSSFALSILTLMLVDRNRLIESRSFPAAYLSRMRLSFLYLATLGALFLATTRAAYIAYALSILYIAFSRGGVRHGLRFIGRVAVGAIILLTCVQPFFDVLRIFVGGYKAFAASASTGSDRFESWSTALRFFLTRPYLGVGFGFADMIHNVYLQMLFGLGIVGFSLLLATCIVMFLRTRTLRSALPADPGKGEAAQFLLRIRTIGLLHICWFALSNHNLNHFLTWYVVLLTLMGHTLGRQPAGLWTPATPAPQNAS